MKNNVVARNIKKLVKVLGLPTSEAAKIEMRTSLVIAIRRLVEKRVGLMPTLQNVPLSAFSAVS